MVESAKEPRASTLNTGQGGAARGGAPGAAQSTSTTTNILHLFPPTFETVAFTASCVSLIETIVCLGDCRLELQTIHRLSCFQRGEGGFLCDCLKPMDRLQLY